MGIKEAAFRDTDGNVICVGQFHDTDKLPDDFKISDEGFITNSGEFLTRSEAAQRFNVNHPLESEDVNFSKSLKEYIFEGPLEDRSQLIFNARHNGEIVGKLSISKAPSVIGPLNRNGYHMIHNADVHALHRGNGVYGRLLQNASSYVKENLNGKGLVSPSEYRSPSATAAWEKLGATGSHLHRERGLEGDDFFMHEDETSFGNIEHEFQVEFKRWLEKRINGEDYKAEIGFDIVKAETELFSLLSRGNLSNTTSDDHHEVARQMAGDNVKNLPDFEAAKFLAGGIPASEESVRLALILYDDDVELAALRAYGLPRNEEYREMLRATKKMLHDTLGKSDMDVTQIPRDIQPALPDAKDAADAVRNAQSAGTIESVQLDPKAKHSKGTAIATDPKTGKKWLLKPGSGMLSPSAGVNEEKADQSSREVVFSKIAEIMGLEEYVPEAHLLTVDGKRVACLRLLGMTWKGLEKIKRSDKIDVTKLFSPYLQNGLIHKWAFLDWVMGNPDRHSNNIMIDKEELDNSSLDTPQSLKLIDHGSSCAGDSFDPAHDPKSFVPYYLRVWTNQSWGKMDAKQRFESLPKLSDAQNRDFSQWVNQIDELDFKKLLSDYGISPNSIINRFDEIKVIPDESKSVYLMELWSGILS